MASQASLSLVQSLYVAYYGRPADPAGLAFWANALDSNNGDVNSILKDFGTSPEYVNRFGGLDNATLVDNLYHQLFGRAAEADGKAYWVNALNSGDKTLAQIAITIGNAATGIDKTVLDGRVQLADAFTAQLDTAAELTAYGTDRGIGIGRDYLDQVNASKPVSGVIGQVIDVVATLVPTDGGGSTGGGGGGTPAPTFGTAITAGVLTFTGTATGPISTTYDAVAHTVTFERAGLSTTVSSATYLGLDDFNIGTATLNVSGDVLGGLNAVPVIGTGTINVSNVGQNTDLSALNASLTVNATTNGNIDLTALNNLSSVDHFTVGTGHTLTLSVAQYPQLSSGNYILKDDAAALLGAPAHLAGATELVVTGAPTFSQLTSLKADNPTVVYTSVTGASGDLITDANSVTGFVTDGINVVVSDAISITDLDTVKAAIGSGTVTASTLEDTAADLLAPHALTYIAAGTAIVVDGVATAAQVTQLATANSNGPLTYDLQDSLINVLANADIASHAQVVTLTGGTNLGNVTVAQVEGLLELTNLQDGSGHAVALADLTYNLVDSASNLVDGSASAYVTHASAVTANTDASVAQAVTLHTLQASAVYEIHDSASSLATSVANSITAIGAATELTAITDASATQAQSIHTNANGVTAHYNVVDTYANITNGSYAAGINGAEDLTANTSNLSVSQANDVLAFGNTGLTTLYSIRDTAGSINTFVNAHAWDASTHYTFSVLDSASNILTAIGNSQAFITGNSADPADHSVTNIQVTDTFDIAGAKTFWNTVDPVFTSHSTTTAAKTTYYVSDTLANYQADEGTSNGYSTWLADADDKTVTGSAADIYAAQTQGIGNHVIFSHLNTGSDHIIASGSAGEQTLQGAEGSDNLDGGADNDFINGNGGNDVIVGGTGYNTLYGGDGRDTIYTGTNAGADTDPGQLNSIYSNYVVGGNGGDIMFGSTNKDVFAYTATNQADLVAETGLNGTARDYISNFSNGDVIQFSTDKLQFLSTGSGNANSVTAGDFALSIRYEKNLNTALWDGSTQMATKVSIDVAKADGSFDNVADATIILVGSNIDVHVEGNTLVFGA